MRLVIWSTHLCSVNSSLHAKSTVKLLVFPPDSKNGVVLGMKLVLTLIQELKTCDQMRLAVYKEMVVLQLNFTSTRT